MEVPAAATGPNKFTAPSRIFHWLTAVLFPIPLVAFVALFARSGFVRLARRPVTWECRTW